MTDPTPKPDTYHDARRSNDRTTQEPAASVDDGNHDEGKGFARFFGRMAGLGWTAILLFIIAIVVIVIMVMTYGAG